MRKYLFLTLASVLFFLFQLWRGWPDELVYLVMCDVGQGDAMLLTVGFTQVLIDGGRGQQVLSCLEEQLPFWDRQLEVMVVTHADSDHFGGLTAVLEHYRVLQIVAPPFSKDSMSFSDFQQAVATEIETGAVLKKPILGAQISFSQEQTWKNWRKTTRQPVVRLTFLSPQVSEAGLAVENSSKTEKNLSDVANFFSAKLPTGESHNNLSIVMRLEIGEITALLTGDLEIAGELALIQNGLLTAVEILKVGHHGAKTSTSQELLAVIRPEISLISVGESNSYGHPSPEVVTRLMQFESQVLSTDQLGTIKLASDGVNYWRLEEALSLF